MGGNSKNLAQLIAYYPFGPIKEFQLGNTLPIINQYDTDYQLTTLKAGAVINRDYQYDETGNVTQISNMGNLPVSVSEALTYSYQNNNNQLTQAINGTNTTFAYNAAGNLITEQKSGVTRTYTYNDSQRLVSVTENSTTLGEYTYDAMGRRTKKVANGTTTLYIYDQNGLLIEECSADGVWQKDYLYLNGQPLAMTVAGTPENVYYYHNDHLGTPQIMTDSTGTVVWAATYEPFGQATMNVEQITNNLRFPGQYFDSETGTHYNGHRDYNNELGRYIESDPIGLPGGINLYVYVLDSPINWIDPFGYFSGDIHISITNLALSKYGASQSSKDKINAGNVYVDRPDNFFNNNEHGMSNWGQYKSDAINRSLLFKENQLRLAIDAAKKCSFQESFFHLGQALHSIQDEIAHDFISLPTHLGDPEYSYRDHYPRESQYREATSISERYIERYLKELGCNPFKHNNDCCCNKNKK